MCGRYVIEVGDDLGKRFDIELKGRTIDSRYNAAPGQDLPVIVEVKKRELQFMNWGLVPFWAKAPNEIRKMINARSEGVDEKPFFRRAFAGQRCLVPASGFYEWKKVKNNKQPYYIHLPDENLFSFAGIYDIWKSKSGNNLKTFAILTTAPNEVLKNIHHRMPVILRHQDEQLWLDHNSDKSTLYSLINSMDGIQPEVYMVSKSVNNPEVDNPNLIQKIGLL